MIIIKKDRRCVGVVKWYGLELCIENPVGTYRSYRDRRGVKHKMLILYDYGYIRGTEGVDNDSVDVFLGPYKDAEYVFVIRQLDPVTKHYNEDKTAFGFLNAEDAKEAYLKQYSQRFLYGGVDAYRIEKFKQKLRKDHGVAIE